MTAANFCCRNLRHLANLIEERRGGAYGAVILGVLTFCLGLSLGSTVTIAQAPPNVLIVGWDGVQRGHLKEMISKGEVPNLMQLASEGNLVAIDILGNTETKPGWVTVLTGYFSEKHRVRGNYHWETIPVGLTILERLEGYYGDENIFTAMLHGKQGNMNGMEERWIPVDGWTKPNPPHTAKMREKDSIQYWYVPRQQYFYTKDNVDLFKSYLSKGSPLDNMNGKTGEYTLQVMDEYSGSEQFAIFVQFNSPDKVGHKRGENSQEYTDDIISLDYWLGRFVEKLKELGVYENTLIYVTSDHGFNEGKRTHNDAPFVFLATNDESVMRRGYLVDIAPTIYESLGINWEEFEPILDGRPLNEPYNPPTWD